MLVFGKFCVDHRCLTRTKIKVRLWLSFSDHTKHCWACCISDLCLGTNFKYFTVCIAVLQKSCYRHYSCEILISGWLWKQSSLLPNASSFTCHTREELQYSISLWANPFHATGLFRCSRKTLENLRFSDVFRRYRKRPVAWNGLRRIPKVIEWFRNFM